MSAFAELPIATSVRFFNNQDEAIRFLQENEVFLGLRSITEKYCLRGFSRNNPITVSIFGEAGCNEYGNRTVYILGEVLKNGNSISFIKVPKRDYIEFTSRIDAEKFIKEVENKNEYDDAAGWVFLKDLNKNHITIIKADN
jgi:hypothetical protein